MSPFAPIVVALTAVLCFAAGLHLGRRNEHRIARRLASDRQRQLFDEEWSPRSN